MPKVLLDLERWEEAMKIIEEAADEVGGCCEYDNGSPIETSKALYRVLELLEIGPGQLIE